VEFCEAKRVPGKLLDLKSQSAKVKNLSQVYICQLDLDPDLCSRQNIHQRTESYIEDCIAGWEPTPSHHPLVDASTFLHSSGPISEVEMEEVDQNYQDEDDNTEKVI